MKLTRNSIGTSWFTSNGRSLRKILPTTRTRLSTAIAKSTFTSSSRPTKRSINFIWAGNLSFAWTPSRRPAPAATVTCETPLPRSQPRCTVHRRPPHNDYCLFSVNRVSGNDYEINLRSHALRRQPPHRRGRLHHYSH